MRGGGGYTGLTSPAPSERKDNTFEKYFSFQDASPLYLGKYFRLCTLKIVWRQCLRRPRPTYIGTCSTGRGSGTGIGLTPPGELSMQG